MRTSAFVAIIAAFPPTLAAILGYRAISRSLRRSIGDPSDVPLATVVQRLDEKLDRLAEGQVATRERLARLEGAQVHIGPRREPRGGRRVQS